MKLYAKIATLLDARKRCSDTGNTEWSARHTETIEALVQHNLPHGSGFDIGTKIDFDKSTPSKLVFRTSFHHMNEHGMYDGWTDHTVTVRPSLAFGCTLTIGGRDRNDIKDYITESFSHALDTEV